MAPEVMRGLNHTGSVDYFAVGVITYELMIGKRPYLGKTRKEIKEQMMIKQIFLDENNIPLGWSKYAADFINRLLLRKDSSRLGYYNDLEVKQHPWLNSINFDDLVNYKLISPFLPRKNHDNYDKKYCQEIEEIGIDTNLRYDEYRHNERYTQIFEGFTFYNVDESKIIQYHEIYKKPSVKYMKNNLNLSNNNNSYTVRKSRTINIDYDYKNKINPNISPRNKNLSPIKNQNISSYRNRSNINNRTINYSNADNSTSRKTPKTNLKHNQSSSLINNSSKLSLKNGEDIYIMASPMRRGRITINSNDNNIDDSFRRYANHSFVETNYSKGKIFRRSYSSSNLHNSNYVNIFNLLVNNVNNINNNNIINNNNNTTFRNYSKLSTPIRYDKINKGRIPLDRRPNSSYKNYNNYYNNFSNNYHHHHRSCIENPKNYSFYFVDNENLSYNYNNNIYNNYNNFVYYNNNCNTYRFRNKDLNSIFNEIEVEEKKNYTIKKDREKDKYNNPYYLRQKIPTGSIKKIIPLNLKDRSALNNNIINLDYSNRKSNNLNYNKIQTIDYINERNFPNNNSLFIDKYENKSFSSKNDNKIIHIEKAKEVKINNKISSYKTIDSTNSNQSGHSFNIEKNINKRNAQIVKHNNSYNNININKMNNNFTNSNSKTTRSINKANNENSKNLSYKKIPLPSPLGKTLKKKKTENNEKKESTKIKSNITKINNINNNNTVNNNVIKNSPINYNKEKTNCNNNTCQNKENIKNNNLFNKNKNNIEINNFPKNNDIDENNKNIKNNNKSENYTSKRDDNNAININKNNNNNKINIPKISINNNSNIPNNDIINKNNSSIQYNNINIINNKNNNKIPNDNEKIIKNIIDNKSNNEINKINNINMINDFTNTINIIPNVNNLNNISNSNTKNNNINSINIINNNNPNNIHNYNSINNNNIIFNNNNINNKLKLPYNNQLDNLNFNQSSNKKEKKDIISLKINEKTFCQYKYLENFDKYKKIKNNNRNKNKCLNKENNNKTITNNIIKKKINEKYRIYGQK